MKKSLVDETNFEDNNRIFQILNFNSCKVSEFLMYNSNIAHIFGPRKDKVSIPYDTFLAEFNICRSTGGG